MKRLLYIVGVLVLTLNAISCKDHYYIENDLHGVWQVTSIEKLSTGEVTEPAGDLYYMFQRSMVMLGQRSTVPGSMKRYIAHFDFVGSDSLGMGDFRNYTTGEGNYVNQESKIPLGRLHKFGLYQDYTMFHMLQSKQKLILTSDSARLILRRY